MSYTVLTAKQELSAIIHGTQLNKVQNINGLFNRAARQILQDLDPQETIRIQQLNPVFTGVWDYPIPPDVKGTKIIDVFPQVNRTPQDITLSRYNQDFDLTKGSLMNQFTVIYNTGTRYLRLNNTYLPVPITINGADDTQDNGTWTTGNDANNLVDNNTNFVFGGGSLQFDLTFSAGNGFLVNSTSQVVDLSALLNQGSIFLNTYLPVAAEFNQVTIQWGSSTTDYYSNDAFTNQQGNTFQDGWNLLQFPWYGATVVGSPNPASITYIKVIWDCAANQTGVLLNLITAAMPSILNLEYYSKDMFQDNAGIFQETVTDDSNIINLDTDAQNIFINQLAYLVTQQIQGLDALFNDAAFFLNLYTEGVARYKSMYKSQIQKPQTNYYVMPPKGYQPFLPRRWS